MKKMMIVAAFAIMMTSCGMLQKSSSNEQTANNAQTTTNTTTAIETITNNQSLITGKFIKDGQLIIIRDGKTYNAQGQMVK